jgi:hypothetical protein
MGVTADTCAGGSHCSLSRTSSVADNVFRVGSGLLVKGGEELAGGSPRSRRRCPFVIGVAGGTGQILMQNRSAGPEGHGGSLKQQHANMAASCTG